ncbi:arylsulfatase [Poritiphilus flavus]|uniref:Sulfatase-like hydrolase/transferase n=1 Tax=Poritiphilus flavus TaxID=2697053 RepID=A0A6L9EA17_9FLAO|nr:arylsulfatase [Poritiphilus flavus]NAS11550.1 sulfatase-like hydrolase/transferase [Poritiphilus flavus]
MRLRTIIFSGIALALLFVSSCKNEPKPETSVDLRPNIIYILADDLGYGELGAYGQELIETPNIDALARSGMLFTQHYSSAPVCAPARYMLMTGQHSGHAHIRGNEEWRERGAVWDYIAMAKDSVLEGQRPMPETTVTLPMKLKEIGYATGMVGKWGLGAPHTHSIPTKMGFDYFYGYNCQRQAHTYYPLHLYENENRVHLNNDTVPPHTGLAADADPLDANSYANFNLNDYTPALMFEALTSFVEEQKSEPFFLYWATPIPHVAIQAPRNWVDYYRKKFGEEEPYLADNGFGYFPHQYPHAGYAAMISYLDENVGKLVAQLKEAGIYENTLIVFTSDNGPSYAGGADPAWFKSAGSLEGGFGRGKGFVYEGGIRVPMIASWPQKIKAGTVTDHISAHYDVMATLADICGFEVPDINDGISFAPTLLGEDQKEVHEFLLWEFPEYGGQVAMRMGDWKLIRQNLKSEENDPTVELYNLKTDPREQQNVAETHPEVLQAAAEIFASERTEASIEKFKVPILDQGLLNEE